MRYLLDTHIVIWAMVGSDKLSDRAYSILQNQDNAFYVSSASVWEVAIKHRIRPEDVPVAPGQMIRFCRDSGIVELPIGFEHAQKVSMLPAYHNDPFDRMLLAQASVEDLLLLSHDRKLPPYGDFVVLA
jgi:PIN domain nuclease of toxin-antitoxin system